MINSSPREVNPAAILAERSASMDGCSPGIQGNPYSSAYAPPAPLSFLIVLSIGSISKIH